MNIELKDEDIFPQRIIEFHTLWGTSYQDEDQSKEAIASLDSLDGWDSEADERMLIWIINQKISTDRAEYVLLKNRSRKCVFRADSTRNGYFIQIKIESN